MTDKIDISREGVAAMLDGVTPGPWRLGSWQDNVFGTGPKDEWLPICRIKRDNAPIEESPDHKDARFIAWAREAVPALSARLAEVEIGEAESEGNLSHALHQLRQMKARAEAAEAKLKKLQAALFLADEGCQFINLYVDLAHDVNGADKARAIIAEIGEGHE